MLFTCLVPFGFGSGNRTLIGLFCWVRAVTSLLVGKGVHRTFYLGTAVELIKSVTQLEHQTLIVEFQVKGSCKKRGIRFSDWDATQNNSTIAAIQICIGIICIECPSNPIPYKTEQCADYM